MNGTQVYYTLLILGIAFFPYTQTPYYSYLLFGVFILTIGMKLVRMDEPVFDHQSYALPLLLFCIQLVVVIVQGIFRLDFDLMNAFTDTLQRILVVSMFILVFSNCSVSTIAKVFDAVLAIFFWIGLVSVSVYHLTGIGYFNENTLGFFLFPYLGLQLYKRDRKFVSIAIFLAGLALLNMAGGRASLLAFSMTPLWFWMFNKPLRSKILLVFYLLFSSLIPFILMDFLLYYDDELTGRGSLQHAYIQYLNEHTASFVFGTGEFVLIGETVDGLGPHHSWLGLLFTYGLVGLLLNLLFILFCLQGYVLAGRSKLYLLLILYLFTVQNFENINVGGISYMSLLLLSCLFLLRKSRGEGAEPINDEGVRKRELHGKYQLYHL
ncbi:hypothetical protein AB1K83_12670 [Sporosarcina sp. 179-K 3D1 HS]|uniref:hypothetical protein n=1 Tax=Sporosarcina sp. 179-K 3D1 HS TaxID=3232169 RepID=UPI00399F77A8